MSRHDHADARCADCMMAAPLCICALIPALVPRTRLLLLIHYREARKPTNTGQLAARALAGSQVAIVGDLARPLPVPLVADPTRAVLLFPADDAVPITQFANAPEPLTLIIPDGNWRQASKMRHRIPGLDKVPCVTLPDGAPTAYELRSEPKEGGLATLEAIARALAVLEGDAGPAISAALLAVFQVMVERRLGRRRRPRVVAAPAGSGRTPPRSSTG